MENFDEELKALLKKYNKEIRVAINPIIIDAPRQEVTEGNPLPIEIAGTIKKVLKENNTN